ncbi:MAG: tetratricopeptide repeat protein [Bacteroidales bacterium]|nr:tetratricopeptide repeat protein [Bacteroidales bacterium]MDT8431249.1 tetratricopeptide repeat protein [Bacteroidales bacterium]
MKRDRHIIQKYLDHDLTDKDMKRFEADLESSPELQADLGLYQEIDEALADTEVLSFRDQLTDLRKETKKNGKNAKATIRFNKPWHYAATAAIALILAIGLASVLDRPLSNKDLLKKYYKPYEVALMNRSLNDPTTETYLTKASLFYQEGDFMNAIEHFELFLENQPDNAGAQLYLGISLYEEDRYHDAEVSLNKVVDHQDNLYVDKAEWYLGLCYLALNENERARRKFAVLASGNSDKADEAQKLLRKIKVRR